MGVGLGIPEGSNPSFSALHLMTWAQYPLHVLHWYNVDGTSPRALHGA